MSDKYVCAELELSGDYYACKKWVVYEQSKFLSDLEMMTKDDVLLVGDSLVSVFAVILAFVVIAYAVKKL